MENVSKNGYKCETVDGLRYYSSDGERSFIVISAGRQHDGETWVKYYHVIDTEHTWGWPNGLHEVVDEYGLSQILKSI